MDPYILDKHIRVRVNWDKFMEHRDFLADILNNIACASPRVSVRMIRLLGGADEIGERLHAVAREVVADQK